KSLHELRKQAGADHYLAGRDILATAKFLRNTPKVAIMHYVSLINRPGALKPQVNRE
ncbi:unnamed protein product, partial [marine sediment metagenome]